MGLEKLSAVCRKTKSNNLISSFGAFYVNMHAGVHKLISLDMVQLLQLRDVNICVRKCGTGNRSKRHICCSKVRF